MANLNNHSFEAFKEELSSHRFAPALMLPAWFVTDGGFVVKEQNDNFTLLMDAIAPEWREQTWTAENTEAENSIWNLLISKQYQEPVAEMISLARKHRQAVTEFIAPSTDISTSLENLVRLIDTDTSSKITAYAYMPAKINTDTCYLRAGVRISPPGGIKTNIHQNGILSQFHYVSIVVAWRILVDCTDCSQIKVSWHGIQPALHDALAQKKQYDEEQKLREESERYRVWLQNASGIKHGLGEGLDHVGNSLEFARLLLQALQTKENEALLTAVRALIGSRADLKEAARIAPHNPSVENPHLFTELTDALGFAEELNIQHMDFCNFMGRLGDIMKNSRDPQPADEMLELTHPEILKEEIDKLARRVLKLSSRKREIPSELRHTPVLYELPENWQSFVIYDRILFQFTLFQFLLNASQYSSLKEPFIFRVSIDRDVSPKRLIIALSNDLDLNTPEELREKGKFRDCESDFHAENQRPAATNVYLDRQRNKYLCGQCLKDEYYHNVIKRCYEFGVGRKSGGRGLFMIQYYIETYWKGKLFAPEIIVNDNDWDRRPRKNITFGYSVAEAAHTWGLIEKGLIENFEK